MNNDQLQLSPRTLIPPPSLMTSSSSTSLKRRASSSFERTDDVSRKRVREGSDVSLAHDTRGSVDNAPILDDVSQDLQCACCAELVYRPVLVLPCQHFFCGSCVVLWIKNSGTNCPTCRGPCVSAVPFRAIQPIIDSLLRAAPHKIRAERERQQADELYTSGNTLKIPLPKEHSPPPDINRSTEYMHPCPHCAPNNPFGWNCPQPVVDPATNLDRAWPVEDGMPPGHAHCGNCENLMAQRAPQSTQCEFCLLWFCGVHTQDRCQALPLREQTPQGLTNHADLIESSDIYDCFDGNVAEVEIMLEHIEAQGLTPRHIYRQIVQRLQSEPFRFKALFERGLFADVMNAVPDVNPDAPRENLCRVCALDLFLYGLKDWWIQERAKGFVEEAVLNRKDCPQGNSCPLQAQDPAHARQFNHLVVPSQQMVTDRPASTQSLTGNPPTTGASGSANPLSGIPSNASSFSLSFLLAVDHDSDSRMGSPEPSF